MGGVEYQVTKVDPTDPQTKGAVYQVHKVSEEIAATLGGKVYRARIIKDPTEPTVAGKVYQIVLIDDPDDPSVKGKVYNAILTGGSEAVVVGPAVSPLALDDAVADTLEYVKAYGGTKQGLPNGYTMYDSLIGDGSAYIDLDCVLDQNDEIEIDFMKTSSVSNCNVFGGRDSATANNISVIIASSGNVVADFNNSDYAPYRVNTSMSQNTMYKVVVNKTGRYVYDANGTLVNSNTTACEDTISAPGCYVFNLAGSGLASKFAGVVYKCIVKGKRDCVPAYNGTEYGMYDKISGRFFGNANTEGAFTAGNAVVPAPTTPLGIICNNGALKYSTNMANINAQTALIGYYISSSGVVTADANNWVYQDYILVKPNTTYTLSFDISVYYVTISEYSTADDSGFVVRKAGASGTNTSLTITTGATTNYIRFGTNIDRARVTLEEVLGIHWMLNPGGVLPYQPYVEGGFYVDGTVETIKDSLNNTATAEMLLKVGDYQDEQEILSGEVTRKCGVYVFDGSETFISGQNGWITEAAITDQIQSNTYVPFCTHFLGTNDTPQANSNTIRVYRTSNNTGRVYFGIDKSRWTTTTAFQQWVAEQYAAGTPIIVVYALDTPTTESVAGQTLQVQDGDNTLEITQASIDGLELEAEYEKEA